MKPSITAKPKPIKVRPDITEQDRRAAVAAYAKRLDAARARKKEKVKEPTRKDRAMQLFNRILAGPTFERSIVADLERPCTTDAHADYIMNYLFRVYSAWMEITLDEYVEFVPELRDTELAERRKSAKRKRAQRE